MSWLIISCSSQLIVHFDMKPASWWESWTYFSSCFRSPVELIWANDFKGSPYLQQHSRRAVSDTGGHTVFLVQGMESPCTHRQPGAGDLMLLYYLWEIRLCPVQTHWGLITHQHDLQCVQSSVLEVRVDSAMQVSETNQEKLTVALFLQFSCDIPKHYMKQYKHITWQFCVPCSKIKMSAEFYFFHRLRYSVCFLVFSSS